ncbi:YeiH family putative sulfate export transporter [Salmonella enterica]|nr:YeiH family putative sulfate export transporter [Salmonella enterica subsp. enterica serovar Takoradi]EEU6019767.1 YeiH family putative sulfate export transporter [Salmonella enterica]EEU6037646.1 YeiH family putative sulfate export transporter [Salmonella enterica]EEU6071299.1 YeiH family putative sulfate export transporter [Salmonella enterica]EEU6080194.1 YeiH family putative sulfate export transporter [Salmonella enterica]
MTELTLQNHRRTMWHFIPGLALSAVITGVALWGGAIPAVAGAGFSPETYGIYIGSTMHEVAQVVAAGHAVSPDAENAAVIAKMLRVMMLAPFLIILAARVKQLSPATGAEKSKITIPWFAIFFIVVAIFNSFHLLPKAVVDMLVTLDTVLLAMAMAALGLTTHVSALKKAGAKPLLMALALFAWLIIGGGAINVLIHSLIA